MQCGRNPLTSRVAAALLLLAGACGEDEPVVQFDDYPVFDADLPNREFEIFAGRSVEPMPGEARLRNIRQLTFGGENTAPRWSSDGTRLVFQRSRPPEIPADQVFVLNLETGEETLVSTGKGRASGACFLRGDGRVTFASTHRAADTAPTAVPVLDGDYVWPLFETFDLYTVNVDGTDLQQITASPGYDAEATVDPKTGRIAFTSTRGNGDLELYSMDIDGSDVIRITDRFGYDGGPAYDRTGTRLVQSAGFVTDTNARTDYRRLLQQGYANPASLEITVVDLDESGSGTQAARLTTNGCSNFAPSWFPDGERVIFTSNQDAEDGRNFELYVIDLRGENQERITHAPVFDGYPTFSPDGKHLVFCSDRYATERGERNLFVAEWVD